MELLIADHVTFSDEHKRLLTAQVLLTDAQRVTEKKIQDLTEAQKHTDERMNALIGVVDGLIHKPPGSEPKTA
jgi:hypothetical protein